MLEIFLISFFSILLFYYVVFLFSILNGLNKLKLVEEKVIDEFASIIIPFRNESENILYSLKSIEQLTYPKNKYEVIYVNDDSTDDSLSKLKSAIKSDNIKVIAISGSESSQAHKKRAVKFGIENSKGDIIVTTDADCIHNPNWLQSLLSYFDENTGLVSGPVDFIADEKIFTKLQRLEFAGLILSGAGLIGNETPAICNGANLAYRIKAYEKVKGFEDNLNLSSGEDEILMQKIFNETDYQVKFCLNKSAFALTKANKTLLEFFQQRKRWASKGLFYKNKFLVFKLIAIFLFYCGIITQLFLGLFYDKIFVFTFTISFILKLIFEYKILKKGAISLYSKEILKPFFIAEILHIPYIIFSSIAGLFGNYKWKERKVSR